MNGVVDVVISTLLQQQKKTLRCMVMRHLTEEHKRNISLGMRGLADATSNWAGYRMIRVGNKQVREHRFIYQQYHKCSLLPYTDIHHINGDRKDNRIENLQPMIHGKHSSITHKKDMSDRFCINCGVNSSPNRRGNIIRQMWYRYKLKWICSKCYKKKDSFTSKTTQFDDPNWTVFGK